MADGRARSWTFIVYPESAPELWRTILDDLHIEWVESPLHEFDINPDGELKKAHWHILISFTNVKSYEQVLEITKLVNGTIPQRCHNTRSLIRYMAHLDNPEKHQYKLSEIIGHGGVDPSDFLAPSASERYELTNDIIEFCKTQGIFEFQDIVDYARQCRFDDWFPILCNYGSSLIILNYLKSARHRKAKYE